MTSLTRSIAAFQTHLERNFKSVTQMMEDLGQVESLTKNQTDRFKELVTVMKERYNRIITKWEENADSLDEKPFDETEKNETFYLSQYCFKRYDLKLS